jgi:hypothetical protein
MEGGKVFCSMIFVVPLKHQYEMVSFNYTVPFYWRPKTLSLHYSPSTEEINFPSYASCRIYVIHHPINHDGFDLSHKFVGCDSYRITAIYIGQTRLRSDIQSLNTLADEDYI